MDSRELTILLRLPNWLGDAVMASPAIESLKAHFKSAKFILVGTEASCGIYSRDLRVGQIFIDSTKKSSDGRKNNLKNRFLATKKFAREIRESIAQTSDSVDEIDIAIDFTNHFFSALLIYLIGAKIRIGYAKNIRTILLNKRVRFIKKLHQVASYMNLVREICGKKLIKKMDSNLRESLLKSAPLKLQNRGLKGFKSDDLLCIGINPGAAYGSAKRWEERYFVEIILHFLKNDCAVFVFGVDSLNLPESIAQNPRFHSLIGQTSITELVDYISSMDIFISNDSGPMHIAAAFKVPLIAIFGATDSSETSPWVDNAVILDKHLPCAPCKKRECPLGHHNCMKLITPDEVIERVERILGGQFVLGHAISQI